jgi:hypothetical protein
MKMKLYLGKEKAITVNDIRYFADLKGIIEVPVEVGEELKKNLGIQEVLTAVVEDGQELKSNKKEARKNG